MFTELYHTTNSTSTTRGCSVITSGPNCRNGLNVWVDRLLSRLTACESFFRCTYVGSHLYCQLSINSALAKPESLRSGYISILFRRNEIRRHLQGEPRSSTLIYYSHCFSLLYLQRILYSTAIRIRRHISCSAVSEAMWSSICMLR